jgi:hypothetical protein
MKSEEIFVEVLIFGYMWCAFSALYIDFQLAYRWRAGEPLPWWRVYLTILAPLFYVVVWIVVCSRWSFRLVRRLYRQVLPFVRENRRRLHAAKVHPKDRAPNDGPYR